MTTTTSAEDVAWTSNHSSTAVAAGGLSRQLDEANRRAKAFAATHAGKVAELDGPGLAEAMRELGEISELVGKAGSYASLLFSVDTADPEIGAFMQDVTERATQIETTLQFFELEWAALEDVAVDELLTADGLDTVRHYLRTARRYRPHLLSEPRSASSPRSRSPAAVHGRGCSAS